MWRAISGLVKAMPSSSLPVLVLCMAFLGVWVFSHLRTDKQGKRYWYSEKYEQDKRNRKQDNLMQELTSLRGLLDSTHYDMKVISEKVVEVELKTMRVEILNNIHLCPEKVEVISALVDKYIALGGNSYITNIIVPAWKAKYAAGVVNNRI